LAENTPNAAIDGESSGVLPPTSNFLVDCLSLPCGFKLFNNGILSIKATQKLTNDSDLPAVAETTTIF